jgi:hypothetical protein
MAVGQHGWASSSQSVRILHKACFSIGSVLVAIKCWVSWARNSSHHCCCWGQRKRWSCVSGCWKREQWSLEADPLMWHWTLVGRWPWTKQVTNCALCGWHCFLAAWNASRLAFCMVWGVQVVE